MFTIGQLKVNKHMVCIIPSAKQLFARFGFSAPKSGSMTGDEFIASTRSKVQNLAEVERIAFDNDE